ncbi:CHT4 [Candida jiufengensis]|uniref:CHT4 n=1 Tax=Candida jiufengensis TaxID=497108 RepID=UPI002224B1A1|nr:CHT4 [Candida jiufengensis]KAI5951363.1 CHT4 [Candida jiufengensis]
MVSDSNKMDNFVTSAVQFVEEYGFDGIDIDWEFCGDHQGWKFVDLLKKLRQSLPSQYILTIAAPGGQQNIQNLKIKEMDQYLTFWNLMCYDFSGQGWSTTTGYHSNLFGANGDNDMNAADIVQTYLQNGVSPSKLILGQPMYGRVFSGVGSNSISKKFAKQDGEDTMNYNEINQEQSEFDHKKVSAYSYDPKTKKYISYDNPQSAKVKSQFVKSKNLGGGMWWDSSGDKQGEDSLVYNFVNQLGGVDSLDNSENNLSYPRSKYLKNLQ